MSHVLQFDDKMDITEKFQQLIVSKPFPTFENFKQTLKLFTELTGSQFTIKRRMRHKTNAPMRDAHIFRCVTYACICTFSTECEVFFHIESKGKCIRVTQFYMTHNHEIIYNPAFEEDDSTYDVQCDLTDHFEEMFPEKCFDTFDEFWNKLKEFQAKTGSIYIKHNACRWPASALDKAHLVYRVVKIECVHYGRHECKSNQPNIKMSCKIGCKSCIRVTSGTGRVVIGKFNMKHNHPVPIESAIQYPLNTLLADERKRNSEYHVQADVTTEFVETFASGRFSTYNDFLLRLEEFQQVTGFYYSKRNSDLWPPDAVNKQHLKYKFAVFDCVHYGYTHSNRRQRNTERRAGFWFVLSLYFQLN
uniref:FAR1 domain-containing protein n=1 Tax=Schistocephalus solidus TaxID=70667 RepID=A0A0V0J7E6_SCHSO